MNHQTAVEDFDPLEEPNLSSYPRVAILGLATLAILAWLILAFAHLGDRSNVNAVSGTLLALADRAGEGVLYPPLFDGESYGGTRTMPLPILLYAAAMSLGGEILAPAKVVDFLAAAALVVLLVGVLRQLGASTAMRLGLTATVVTSQVFLLAGAGIRPEALPTALQLGAVALVAFVPRRTATLLAGLLCAVAIFTKVSALWAPIAIVLWLVTHDRRRLALFGVALMGGGVALLGVFSAASEGRMLTNLLGLGGAGLSLIGVLKAPLKATELLAQYAEATFVLIPVLLLGGLLVGRGARPTILQVALVAATGVLLVAMADVGSDYNHLLDVVVLVPIVAFEVMRALARRVAAPRLVWSTLAATIIVGSTAALAMNAGSSLASTLGLPGASSSASIDPHPFEQELRGATSVLAEDPYLNLARGERPTVVDPFMLIRIARRDRTLVEPFLDRVRAQGFDAVVLSRDLEDPDAEAWFSDFAFGQPFYEAMREAYQLCGASGGGFLYVPASRSCPI